MATTLLSLHEGTWSFFSQKCDPFPQFPSRCERGGSFSYVSSSLAFPCVWILPTRHCCSTNLCEKNLSVGLVNGLSLLLLLYLSVKLGVSKNLGPLIPPMLPLAYRNNVDKKWSIWTILLPNGLLAEAKVFKSSFWSVRHFSAVLQQLSNRLSGSWETEFYHFRVTLHLFLFFS